MSDDEKQKFFNRVYGNIQKLRNSSPSTETLKNDSEKSLTFFQKSFSSLTGSTLTALAVTPLDVIKIRLQAQHKVFDHHHHHQHHHHHPLHHHHLQQPDHSIYLYRNGLMDFLCECNYCRENPRTYRPLIYRPMSLSAAPVVFNGTRDAFLKIIRLEGVPSLWSGLWPTLVLSLPLTIVYFPLYDLMKYEMGYDEQDPTTSYIPPVAGSICRALMVILFNPLELFRTKLQSKKLTYIEMYHATKVTFSHTGFTFLFSGMAASLLRDVPFSAMYWYGYERIKADRVKRSGGGRPSLADCFVAGAVSGSIAALLTLPFDVIKTHRQIELGTHSGDGGSGGGSGGCGSGGKSGGGGQSNLPTTWQMIERLYKSKGLKGLFAGAVPRLVKVAPACAIMISTYEGVKTFFIKYNMVAGGSNHDND